MNPAPLIPLGWGDRWAALLAEHPGSEPARVMRHDSSALMICTPGGTRALPLTNRIDPEPVVGDWLAVDGDVLVAVLPRTSLLRRKAAHGDRDQAFAANVDVVLITAGLDRPVLANRLSRTIALAWDAGAMPVVVLSKAALSDDAEAERAKVTEDHPGVEVIVTSVVEGVGTDRIRALVAGRTATLIGESGAGKSSIVNALLGGEAAAVGAVRKSDSKGRHTTTSRNLHVVPSGGVLIDTPGIRAVGLWTSTEAVDETFADVEALAEGCRFGDCGHGSEPGCAVLAAVADGTLAAARLDSWRQLQKEAEAVALRTSPQEQRRRARLGGRLAREAQRHKPR